jgi:hypothetical protein
LTEDGLQNWFTIVTELFHPYTPPHILTLHLHLFVISCFFFFFILNQDFLFCYFELTINRFEDDFTNENDSKQLYERFRWYTRCFISLGMRHNLFICTH